MSRDVTTHNPVTRHTPEYGGGDLVTDVTLGCLMSRWLLPAVQSPRSNVTLSRSGSGRVMQRLSRGQGPDSRVWFGEDRVCHSLGLWRLSVEHQEQPDSPQRQETSLEGWGCYPPNLNIAFGCKHISCTQTNIARNTRQFQQSHVMSSSCKWAKQHTRDILWWTL